MAQNNELDPRLLQGNRSHKEWMVALGFTRRWDRLNILFADAVVDIQEVPMSVDFDEWMPPSQMIIRKRQEEIQEWADAVAAAEADEAAMYGLDLNDFGDRAFWDMCRPEGGPASEVTDYSQYPFEFGQIVSPSKPSFEA